MPEQPPGRSLATRVLDLLVYAPVGFVTSAREELPALAVRGREQLGGQIANARVVGELVVTYGRQELMRRLPGVVPSSGARGASPPATPGTSDRGSGPPPPTEPAAPPPDRRGPPAAQTPPNGSLSLPPVLNLAIPDYDTLSASQVVRRLDGLSPAELDTVRRYESAGRRRRTVLHRVEELSGHSVVSDQPDTEA